MDSLIKNTYQTLVHHSMLEHGDTVVVGVSGGPDSVCLMWALRELAVEWKLRLVVAHLDHSTRDGESSQDAEFVERMVGDLGLECVIQKHDVPGETCQRNASFQETARRIRSEFLEAVRVKHKAQRIAVGHILEDQVETVLIHLLRGSGTRGIGGMRPVRGNVIRPLYFSTRDEILGFLESRNVGFREDSSNAQPDYLRNRIRLELIPSLRKEFNPQIVKNIFEGSQVLQWDEDHLDNLCKERFEEIGGREAEDQKVYLRISGLKDSPQAMKSRLVREAYRLGKGDLRKLSFFHVQQVLALLHNSQSGKNVSLPDDWVATLRGEKLLFHKISEPKPRIFDGPDEGCDWDCILKIPGQTALEDVGVTLNTRVEPAGSQGNPNVDRFKACLDWEKAGPELTVRFFRAGDRFRPLGMTGTKKLKDFLIDQKIPREERKRLPLLTSSGGDIIWVYGVRVSEDFKVTAQTKNVLIIEGLVAP